MTDSYSDSRQQGGQGDGGREGGRGGRGGRGQGNREGGGFRIRLSDNEMRSVRALQEAFNLRSTVAVLGFAVRTLGQMLEEGKLDELVAEMRNQPPDRQARRGSGEGREPRKERAPRVDPFARPSKPKPAPMDEPEEPAQDQQAEQPIAEADSSDTGEPATPASNPDDTTPDGQTKES